MCYGLLFPLCVYMLVMCDLHGGLLVVCFVCVAVCECLVSCLCVAVVVRFFGLDSLAYVLGFVFDFVCWFFALVLFVCMGFCYLLCDYAFFAFGLLFSD